MNPIENMLPENDAALKALQTLAEGIAPEPQFKSKLEADLKSAHRPRASFHLGRRDVLQFAGLTVALALLAFVLSWAIRSLVPPHVPSGQETATPTRVEATPTLINQASPYVVQRGDTCAGIAANFNVSVDELIAANHMAANCSDLRVGMELAIPIQGVITVPQGEAYDWYGNTLYLNAELPALPIEANVYLAQPDQHATVASARALAQRFGIAGQVYESQGQVPGTTDYVVTEGGPHLYVRSDNYFSYYREIGGSFIGGLNLTDEQAAAAIDAFMQSHGFNFEYRIEPAPQIHGEYYAVPLLDGQPLRFDYLLPTRLDFLLDDDAQVMSVTGALLTTEKVGTYGLRTAQEAFQKILDNTQYGVQESMLSAGMLEEQIWLREYPDNTPVTLFGDVSVLPAAEAGQPPLLTLNNHDTLTGNTTGLEALPAGAMVEISGQFIIQKDVRVFQVEAWQNSNASSFSQMGSLHRDGDQITLAAYDGTTYPVVDVPADVVLDTDPSVEEVDVSGILVDGRVEWTLIQHFPPNSNGGGGGGGGGGSGFHQLNLTGTPMPLPTSMPILPSTGSGGGGGGGAEAYLVQAGDTLSTIAEQFGVSVDELMQMNGLTDPTILAGQTIVISVGGSLASQKIEDQRGILTVTLYNQADGSQRVEFAFVTNDPNYPYMLLEGEDLQGLESYQNRPINVWGTIDHYNNLGLPVLKVDKYEIPFPDLQFQVLKGTEQTAEIEGQTVLLFTGEDNKTYVQLAPNCYDRIGPESVVGTGQVGEPILLEALVVPDLAVGDYPAICVFSTAMAISPKNGQPIELPITADQPYTTEETIGVPQAPSPVMTIEKVELVYYIADPQYLLPNQWPDPAYVQPMWRFYGHYSNGSEFEFLVQALKDEFLSPEIQSVEPPG
jgi:LysM repeat protein